MSTRYARLAVLSLFIAVLALPTTAADVDTPFGWLARVALQMDAAVHRVISALWPHAEATAIDRAGDPAAFCNTIDPGGCAASSPPVAPAGEPSAFCNTIDPFGCAVSSPPVAPAGDPAAFCNDIDPDGCAASGE